ncbi:hypothetical protein AB833_28800 [Chromatiales bacterium (ex Bugula neritina AB1)]|nr:hypothetical protein AB833_28800 [Chromatiales bacterium (ex Bugula neritina AB1)]
MTIKHLKYSILTLTLLTFNAGAQSFPTCQSADSDPDGDLYGWENNATCLVPDPNTPPVIVRRDNNTTVNQSRAYWQASDLVGKTVSCQNHVFYSDPNDASTGVYISEPFTPEYVHGADGMVTQTIDGNFAGTSAWSITDGVYSGQAFMHLTRFVDADFQQNSPGNSRGWVNDTSFWQCNGATPTGTAPPKPPADCEDTPPVGDGWGWDGATSCQIPKTLVCIDTDPVGDGWGWDGATSCRVGNPVAGACIDTVPVGDGWGWNGVNSCRI